MKRDPVRLSDLKVGAVRKSEIDADLLAQVGTDLKSVRSSRANAGYDVKAGLARFATLAAGAPSGLPNGGSSAANDLGSSAGSKTAAATKGAVTKSAVSKGILGLTSATLAKGVLVTVMVGGGAGALWMARSPGGGASDVTAAPALTSGLPSMNVTAAVTARSTAPSVAAVSIAAVNDSPAPKSTTSVAASSALPDTAVAASADKDSRTSAIKAEMDQLAQVRSASDPSEALALAEKGQAAFPHGIFWQEREVLAIRALRRTGRDADAALRAKTFVARHPESPYAEELDAFLGTPLVKPPALQGLPPATSAAH